MLGKTMLTAMFGYNAETNARLLALAENLTDAQLDAPTGYSAGSLRKTFLHMLGVEWVWRTIIQTHAYPTIPPSVAQSPTLPALRAFAEEESARAHDFIAGVSAEELMTAFPGERGGKTYQIMPWNGVLQLLYHSAQHRSEIAAMLTEHGQSPGDIDFLFSVAPEMRA